MPEAGSERRPGTLPDPPARSHPRVLLAGNPNSGKTTVFNLLTGARAKVGNYPGVTVDRRVGRVRAGTAEIELVDLPGTYSLSARSPEEQVAVDAVTGRSEGPPDAIVLVLDATALRRGLYVAVQLAELGLPLVLAVNMMDEARHAGLAIDAAELGRRLGARVVPIVARTGEGKDALLREIGAACDDGGSLSPVSWNDALVGDVAEVAAVVDGAAGPTSTAAQREAIGRWALLSLGDDELVGVPEGLRETVDAVRDRAERAGRSIEREIIGARYHALDEIVAAAVDESKRRKGKSTTDRVDAVLTHPLWGFAVFAVVMAVVFEALFSWSDPLIGLIEDAVAFLQGAAGAALPEGPIRGIVVDGIIAGVGNVVVFVPQIALLFLFIGILEDSGYLARVAFVLDRLMGGVGLHGKAFVPMLSGFACAIPAVMATRTIESRRDRLLTMMVVPLTSCSARLPVYVLVTAAVFDPDQTIGVVSIGAAVLFSMYFLSIAAALAAAAVLRRTALRGPRPTLVLELPPYRMPVLRNLLASTWRRVRSFLVDAGTIILALTIVLWALLSYPKDDAIVAEYEAQRQDVVATTDPGEAQDERLAAIDAEEAGALLRTSAAGRLGRAIEPAIEPLGFDWRIGIGIIGAFAAREVFVSTLGIVFGISDADEESTPLRESLVSATHADGSPLMTPLAGVSLMVFFVLACQCMSTLAVVRRESGSWRWPIFLFVYMSALAYLASLLVYQVGSAFGWGLG